MSAYRVLPWIIILACAANVTAQEAPPAPVDDVPPPALRVEDVPDPLFFARTNDSSEEERRIGELRRSAKRNISLGRMRLAIEDVKELVVLRPFESEYQLTLGLLFAKSGNFDEARRKYQDFMDLGGGRAVGHLLMAESHAAAPRGGQKDEVFSNLRQAAENGINLMKGVEGFERLRGYRSDTEFIRLALELERYQIDFGEAAVSDPMTNRFRREQLEGDEDEPRPSSLWALERQRRHVMEAKNQLAKIEWALRMQDEGKAMEAYERLVELCEEVNRVTDPQMRAIMRKIISDREEIELRIQEIRLKFLYGRAAGLVEDMQSAFRNEDYPRVNQLHGDVKKYAEKMLEINEQFQEVADKIIEVADEWVRKSEIRREFSAKTLRIEGIVYKDETRFAIVNNRTLRVGMRFEDMRVVKIEPNRVLFRFKGENVPLVFRRY